MSSIEELQGRISVAMARIGSGVEVLAQREAVAEPDPGLAEALAEEQQAVAQLKERLRTLNLKHIEETEALKAQLASASEPVEDPGAGMIEDMRAQMTAQGDALAKLDGDIQRLRHSNEALRKSNAALREANQAGVGDPDLINKAMLAELESLRAARAMDISEAGAVLARLEPLLAASEQTEGEPT